ncbi:MAG: hypothetical protein NC913_01430 [Candidatus Omnitrophica bacterium]|nr:hypothetical protein [Candidatus Omnitrophota bacterium]
MPQDIRYVILELDMTPKERIKAIMNREPHDCLSWTALVDNNSIDFFPKHLRENFGIDFYKAIGCDIFLLNGWNTPFTFRSPQLKWSKDILEQTYQENGKTIRRFSTPKGNLIGVYGKGGHPVKYMIDSVDAVKIYTKMWEQASFLELDDKETFDKLESLVGDNGIVTRFWGPSTIPRLLEIDMGIENFYYLLNDYPDEMEELIDTIHKKEKDAFRILANCPCDYVILVENTSTYYISPEVYKQYNMPHQQEFVKIIKNAGKTAIIHMCGHVKNLLHLIKDRMCWNSCADPTTNR